MLCFIHMYTYCKILKRTNKQKQMKIDNDEKL